MFLGVKFVLFGVTQIEIFGSAKISVIYLFVHPLTVINNFSKLSGITPVMSGACCSSLSSVWRVPRGEIIGSVEKHKSSRFQSEISFLYCICYPLLLWFTFQLNHMYFQVHLDYKELFAIFCLKKLILHM